LYRTVLESLELGKGMKSPANREKQMLSECLGMYSGGWGGIRTHETVARLLVFKTSAFNHSATHPSPTLMNEN
jgi:hypothetical protein